MNDLVSVIIPVFNGEKYICESIRSCVEQTYPNIEIIIINDGSTDNSKNVILEYIKEYKNIKFLDLPHKGKVNAINKGVEISKGIFIAIQAADDICYSDRIYNEVNLMKKNKNNVLIFGDMTVVDEKLNIISKSFIKLNKLNKLNFNNSFEGLLYGNFVSGGTMLINSIIKGKIFPIPSNLLYEDWWIAFVSSYYGNICMIDKPLIMYRQHSSNDNGYYYIKGYRKRFMKIKNNYKRNLPYYEEFKKFIIKNVSQREIMKKYIDILNNNILVNKLLFSSNIIKRISLVLKNKVKNRKIRVIVYMLLGEKWLYYKYYFRYLKNETRMI